MEDMLSILHKPSMLHSAVVHLPIALCTFGLGLLVLAAFLYRNQTIRAVAAMTYGVAAAAAYVAAISGAGANAHVPVNIPAMVSDIRDDHMDMGHKIQYAAAITGGLVLLSLVRWHNARIGFTLLATEGTAAVLRRNGIEAVVVRKHSEGLRDPEAGPTIVDLINAGEVDLVINTPSGSAARADGYEIRMATVAQDRALFTTMSALAAAVAAIEVGDAELTVTSLQEYAERREAARAMVTA